MHRHQAIVPILLYDTTTKSRGLQLHITERRHFTTATPFRVRAMWIYSADRTCCCQSPFPSLQLLAALTASLVSYGVVTLPISHNEFHRRTSFSHPFCLELLFVAPIILWAGSLIFSSIGEFILCLQTPILAQSENNAADRQLSMIIVITNYKGCIQSVLLNPAW